MPKHTPGPWRVLEVTPWNETGAMWVTMPEGHDGIKGDGVFQHEIEIRSSVNHMHDLFGSGEGGHVATVPMTHDGREQALANARLLAAAPDLLAVVEGLLTHERAIHDEDGISDVTLHVMWLSLVGQARAALAKARGEEVQP